MSDLCDVCGEWHADPMCDPDPGANPNRLCSFCGQYECDGSGYNCPDLHYQEYNLRGWGTA